MKFPGGIHARYHPVVLFLSFLKLVIRYEIETVIVDFKELFNSGLDTIGSIPECEDIKKTIQLKLYFR